MVGEIAERQMCLGTLGSAIYISHFEHSVGQVEFT